MKRKQIQKVEEQKVKGEKRNKEEARPTDRAKHPGGLFPSSAAAKEAHDGHLQKHNF